MADITCAVLIGHDLDLLKWNVLNARERAGIDHEWLVVNWIPAEHPEVADPIAAFCAQEGLRYASFRGEVQPADPRQRTVWFLRQLYKGWNEIYVQAQTPWVARMGSDQFFSWNWLKWLWTPVEHFGDRAVYHCWTVESPLATKSRHPVEDFGVSLQTFDVRRFGEYAANLQNRYSSRYILKPSECRLYYQHPARGLQVRVDGVTWLQTVALYDEFKPMRDDINGEGVTGDVDWHDRLFDAGVPAYLVPPSVSFHLVAGESRDREGQAR